MSLRIFNNQFRNPNVVDGLDDRLIEEFAPALTLKWNRYIPHAPTAAQWAFLLLDCQEALYGGAAGGGKSDALLMAALQYVDVPGYAALLLRRTYADLEKPGALIPRSHEWLRNTDAHWNGRRWSFPSGAVLDFGYLDNDADKYTYQSSQYQFIGFDELTQFELAWYQYLFSRKRRLMTMQHVPTRVRGATNPGGIGHEWVKQRFLIEGPAHGRAFVPAKLEDNPFLDREEYDEALKELDPVTRQQLRHGDWTVRPPGIFFKRQWFGEILDAVPAGARTIRMWDLAATKNQTSAYTAGALLSLLNGTLYLSDMRRIRGDPGEVQNLIVQTAQLDGRNVPIWIEQEPGSGGVNTLYQYQHVRELTGYAVRAYLPRHDKLTRATPLSAATRAGMFKLVQRPDHPWPVSVFLDEAESFPQGYKDQVDTCSAGLQVLSQTPVMRIRSL